MKGIDALKWAVGLAAAGFAAEKYGRNAAEDGRVPSVVDRVHDEPAKPDEGGESKLHVVGDEEAPVLQSGDILMHELSEKGGVGLSTGFDTHGEYEKLIAEAQVRLWNDHFRTEEDLEKHFNVLIDNVQYRIEVRQALEKYCALYGVPFEIAAGVVGVESRGNKDAVSSADAKGLFQVKDIVLEELERKKFHGEGGWEKIDLHSVDGGTKAGVAYLRLLFDHYGQWGIALMAFRLGPGAVHDALLEGINQHNWGAAMELGKPPKTWEKKEVAKRGWREFLNQRGVTATFACSGNGLRFDPTSGFGYPFRVEAWSVAASKILRSEEPKPGIRLIRPR